MTFDNDITDFGLTDIDGYFLDLAQDQYPSLPHYPLIPEHQAIFPTSLPQSVTYRDNGPLLINGCPAKAEDDGHTACLSWVDKLQRALQPLRLEYLEIATHPQACTVKPVPSTVISMLASLISQPIPTPDAKGLPRDLRGVFDLHIQDGRIMVSADHRTQTPRSALTEGQRVVIAHALEATRLPGEAGVFASRRDDVNKLARMLEGYLAASGVRCLTLSMPLVSEEAHWASV